ncbi:MAG: AMP-binding protein [Deltaproteobacteria bacterium]|nr:AMP-binding protein [Deltaproteobacteria bacterium]
MKFDVTSLFNRRADNRWDRIALGDALERMTWSYPDKEALVSWQGAYVDKEYERLTYKQCNDIANQFANALLEKGLKRGDRVITFGLNSAEHFLAQVGVAKAGLVLVPINVTIATDVIDYIIKEVEPSFLLIDAQFYTRVEKVFENNQLRVNVTIPIGGEVVPGSVSFKGFISGKSKAEPDVRIHGDDIVQILYTSGTTAWPKGVMLSHIYMYVVSVGHAMTMSRGAGVLTELDYRSGNYYPIFHIASQGMIWSGLMVGGMSLMARSPDATIICESITREKLTTVFGGPVDFRRIADLYEQNPEQYDASTLRVCPCGWGPIPPPLDKRLRKIFGQDLVILSYDGQTECVYDTRGWHHKFYDRYEKNSPALNYLGASHAFYGTRIMDLDGKPCPIGVTGEKVMQSPAMMAAYYKNEKETEEAFKYGWFHSGDACQYDDSGLIIMVDRFKDVIKSGGETVTSLRVENVLVTSPKVEMAAVFGVPHKRWGESVVAAVVPREGETPTEGELIDFCRTRLGRFEVPKRIIFVDRMPISVGTKVKKYELRNRYKDLFKDEE